MNEKKLRFLITLFVLTFCFTLTGFGIYKTVSILLTEKTETKGITNRIELFKQGLTGNNYLNDNDEESNLLISSNNDKLDGVLYIEKLNLEIPLKIADLHTNSDVLHSVAGIYKEYGRPNKVGSNTVIAAHSSTKKICSYCFFNDIEKLKEGDTIELLYKNNITYKYEIVLIKTGVSPYDYSYFEDSKDGKDMLTLITCTGGNSSYRTIIQAEKK